jgi:hypothetical protein
MTTLKSTPLSPPLTPNAPVPPLRQGDRLTADEFMRRYEAMPELKKAELIEGVVYMPSPVLADHGHSHFNVVGWLYHYQVSTLGVVGGDNSTIRLDLGNVPQPDAHLRILESHGGQSRINIQGYVEHAPELAAEVALSSINFDLTMKLPVYQRNGVREYLVWRVPDGAVDWFILRGERYERLRRDEQGRYRSEVFPGLWLDAEALVRGDLAAVNRFAQEGLQSAEHASFVQQLAAKANRAE